LRSNGALLRLILGGVGALRRPDPAARAPAIDAAVAKAHQHFGRLDGVNAFPILGLYHAWKWGLEAFTQSLAAEEAEFGTEVTLIEPAGYSTDWRGASSVQADQLPIYDGIRDYRAKLFTGALAEPGDPESTALEVAERST
jgi:hypothetical protein